MTNSGRVSQEKSTANIGKKFNNSRESHEKCTAKIMEKPETGRAGYLTWTSRSGHGKNIFWQYFTDF